MSAKPFWHYERLLAPLLGIPLGLLIFYFYRLWMVPIPIEVFERHATPVHVNAHTHVTITWNEIRSNVCRSVIYRKLIAADGTIVPFEPIPSVERPVGPASGEFSFVIPEFATEGVVIYRVRTEFYCNWVQELLGGPVLPLQDIHFYYTARR